MSLEFLILYFIPLFVFINYNLIAIFLEAYLFELCLVKKKKIILQNGSTFPYVVLVWNVGNNLHLIDHNYKYLNVNDFIRRYLGKLL